MSQQKTITRETALMPANSPGTSRALRTLGILPAFRGRTFGSEPGAGLFGIPRIVRFYTQPSGESRAELLCNTVRANPADRDLALQQLCGFRDFDALARLAREGSPAYSESAKQYLAVAVSAYLNKQSGNEGFDPKPMLQFLKTVASSENKENALFAVSWLVQFRAVSELAAVSIGTDISKTENYAAPASLEAVKTLHAIAFNNELRLSERASAMTTFPIIFKNTVHPEVRDFLRQKFPQKFR